MKTENELRKELVEPQNELNEYRKKLAAHTEHIRLLQSEFFAKIESYRTANDFDISIWVAYSEDCLLHADWYIDIADGKEGELEARCNKLYRQLTDLRSTS